MNKQNFKLGELFCGPGGIACGAHSAHSNDNRFGIVHAWASDYDPDTCKPTLKIFALATNPAYTARTFAH